MYSYTTVTLNKTKFIKHEYQFWFDESTSTLVLNSYKVWKRDSNNKYSLSGTYSRTMQRNNTIALEDIEFTDEIKKLTLEKFVSNINVEMESR